LKLAIRISSAGIRRIFPIPTYQEAFRVVP
jgi:hypothetical protein